MSLAAADTPIRTRRRVATAIWFAPVFALGVTSAVALRLWFGAEHFGERVGWLLVTHAIGALVGGWGGWWLAGLLARRRPASAKFAAMLIATTIITIATLVLLNYLQFSYEAAEWDDGFPPDRIVFEFILKVAGATYIYAVLGVQLLFPFGLPVLLWAALLRSREDRA